MMFFFTFNFTLRYKIRFRGGIKGGGGLELDYKTDDQLRWVYSYVYYPQHKLYFFMKCVKIKIHTY